MRKTSAHGLQYKEKTRTADDERSVAAINRIAQERRRRMFLLSKRRTQVENDKLTFNPVQKKKVKKN